MIAALAAAAAAAAAALWVPSPADTFQYQLSGKVDTTVSSGRPSASGRRHLDVYSVDGAETPKATVDALHAQGAHVACYLSAGSREDYRSDAGDYPRRLLGRTLDGWPHERWLDVRRPRPILRVVGRRLDQCVRKGFDAADFDNVDAYANRSGFPLTGGDQLRFNRLLARAAHARGLSAGLKNDLGQTEALVRDFDFAVNEQCVQYDECGRYRPFVAAGKAVFGVEYRPGPCAFPGLSSSRKRLSLNAWRRPCG